MQLELGQEYPQPGEETLIAKIADQISAMQRKEYPPGVKPMRRDAHGKHHGVVRAEFIVEPDLPPELAVGLFKAPRAYRAYIRFSNGEGAPKPDSMKDGRGMAIKVLGVPGEKLLEDERDAQTQDFLLISHHSFFVRTLADYVELFETFSRGGRLSHFLGWNPLRWRLTELRHVVSTAIKISNPLTTQYWSTVPFLYGKTAAKFSARPHEPANKGPPRPAAHDYLRKAMVQTLDEREIRFDFLVQLQTSAQKMPVEDATVPWDQAASPYRKVATIVIPKQKFDSDAQHAFAENLSFTPWHSIPEHRPLGAMNRARKHVYTTISKLRHEHNGAPRVEPTGDETF